jgi:twinkle protein
MMVNLGRREDWKFAVCSFENAPEIHISRLMEIYIGKRFFEGTKRMEQEDHDKSFEWVNDHFMFMNSESAEPATLESILARAKVAVARYGIRGMVIDPYNYIEMGRRDGAETESISNMLSRVQAFAKAYGVHVWFVAHPSKMQRSGNELPRPDGMSISGSMAWWAKADCGITVHRVEKQTQIAVWKCRYRWVGSQGETNLDFDPVTGTYKEVEDAF